jgi:hypothetical protein
MTEAFNVRIGQTTFSPMGLRQFIRKFFYSQLVHSGLRNWQLVHSLRSLAASFVAPMDFRSALRKWASDPALSSRESSLLGRVCLRVHRDDGMYVPLDVRHAYGLSDLARRATLSEYDRRVRISARYGRDSG